MANRNRIGIIALSAAFCLLFSASSFAAVVLPGDTIRFAFAPGHASGFPGGAFTITDLTSGSSWNTFCLEYNEYITLGANYFVDTIGPAAVKGGVAGGNPDPISSKTAYLYSLYATGTLSGVTGAGTAAQQTALQNVFWYLENEISSAPTGDLAQFYLGIADEAAAGQYYGVAVMNPRNAAGVAAQSQLVYVPEPAALLLFSSGLACLIGYRKVRRAA